MVGQKFSAHKLNYVVFIFLNLLFIVANFPEIDQKLSQFILNDFRTPLVMITLFSLSFILFGFFQNKILFWKESKDQSMQSNALKERLKSLSYDEKYILSLFINEQKAEKALAATDPNVAWLENMKLIVNTSKIEGNKKIFRIDPTVMKELKKNPNLLY